MPSVNPSIDMSARVIAIREKVYNDPFWGSVFCILFIYSVWYVTSGSLYSTENPDPKAGEFIAYSIKVWCWILIIIILYAMFFL